MNKVRIGIVGLGNMGSGHSANILAGKISRLELTAVADTDPAKLKRVPQVKGFSSADEMIASGLIDAILIATPHYDHTTIGIKALKAGLHVLVEKPISVHRADCERLIAAYKGREGKQIFAAMFNQRTDHYYIKIRNLIRSGELGEIRRVNWIITDWFRTHAYYASGGWRATWAGEGGGVLLNQCPHNLDLFQWMFGMPTKLRAKCGFGKYHDIEVEDDVTAIMEFANGATGVFITTTGEAPGTNRLEITAERGKLVYEADKITFTRNEIPMRQFSETTASSFSRPEKWDISIPAPNHGGQHNEILQNFTDAILDGATLYAPAPEGINSVELANAMILSGWTDKEVTLPIDGKKYERLLKQKIAESAKKPKKKKVVAKKTTASDDFAKSFKG
ncbi:gfo/Idh/MocA family oxidoreductase [Opitutaceae bacterium TAV4]|nr:gfo/Idh/MocA family oxidoreductase [Opitutaceae bacterium TAV4]RRK01968.1 gfo/Idh/MocA family oxidoreductase [Opitutaceae bacterium TAV3]